MDGSFNHGINALFWCNFNQFVPVNCPSHIIWTLIWKEKNLPSASIRPLLKHSALGKYKQQFMNMEIGWGKRQINNNRPFYFGITPKTLLRKLLFVQTTINPSVGCTAKGFVRKDKHFKKTCGAIKQCLKKAIISVFHNYLGDKNSALFSLPLPNLPPSAPRFTLLSPASSWAAKSIPSHCNIMLWLETLCPLCITN